MSEVIISILSALGGSIITAFGFVLSFNMKLTRIEGKLDSFSKRLDNHLDNPPPCEFASDISRHDERIKTLESNRSCDG